MSTGDETESRKALFRMLSMAALTNAVLRALSVIALIFVIHASGLAAGSAVIALVRKQR